MVFSRTTVTKSPQETARVGQELGRSLREDGGRKKEAKIICLYGELGSGKTTFAQGFAKGLGIKSRLLSPTFIIVRRYPLPNSSGFLYHVDLYRMQKKKEIATLGLAEIFAETNSYVVIEWAEKLGELLPKERVDLWFKTLADGRHEIVVKKISIANYYESGKESY